MIYRFGGCELDVGRRELRVGGAVTPVEPQVFDVLAYLVSHHERVVPKEELLDNVWGDRFVSESALTSRIKSARRAVGDSGASQHVVRTIHGRGYRVVATVEAGVDGPAHPPAPGPASPEPAVLEEQDLATAGRSWPLLGREQELHAIEVAFRGGVAGGVLLTGPAGVGKTRLANECLRRAQVADVPVARVSGHPETRSLPLAAVAHLLPAEVTAAAGPEGELDRTSLFHRARVAVEQMTGSSRAMVLVDDVDQLDELSRALLVSLLHARAVFVVATLRTTDGVDAGVAHLVKDEHLIPVTVRPLGAGTVEAVLHRVVGDAIEPTTLAQLVEASNGNPGVLRQLVESAWDAGTFVDRGGRWALDRALVHVSPTFELLVEQRLGGLGDREREAVELVAVAGGLALDVVTTIVEDTVLEHLEQRGLLQVADADGREEVALAHPLFGEVLRAQLPTMRSRRLRRMLADAVTALGAVDPRDRVRVVAWRLEGGGRVDAPLLAEAARLALVDGDDAMAERILARAAPADRSPEIVQLHAELMFRRGDTDAVEALLASLDDVDLADEVRGQILRRRVTNLFYGRGQFREGVDLLAQRLPTLSDPAARAGLEAYHVLLLAMAGRVRDAAARSEPLLDELRGGPRLELLRGRALALVAAARGADALALLPEARDIHRSLAAGLARPGSSMLTFIEVLALSELGRSEEAALAARRSLAGRSDVTTTGWIALAQARVHLATGETGAIREALDPLVRATRDLGHGATERWALALVASARLLEGDRDRAAEDLRRVAALEDGPRGLFHSDIDRAHAWLAAASDDRQGACDRLLVAADDAGRLGKAALEAALLHDVVRFGRPDLVAGRLGGLAGNGQGMLLSARALHAAGAAVDDPTLLAQAADGFEACGTTLLAAEAAAGAAASMEARDDPGAAAAHRRAATLRSRLVDGITTPLLAASSDRTVDV